MCKYYDAGVSVIFAPLSLSIHSSRPVRMMVRMCCSMSLPRWTRAWAVATVPGLRLTPAASVGNQHSRHHSVTTSHSKRTTRWRYPADEAVKNMVAKVRDGAMSDTLAITLNAVRPVSPAVFEEALVHLYRKIESLQLCMLERDGHLWVADMDTPKIDFQVLEDVQLTDIINVTAVAAYNMAEGPLWRIRLVMCPPDEPCKMPQIKDAFPHQYHIVFDFHHAINDGMSSLHILHTFFTILDSLLDGAQVDDKQFGELRDGRELRAAEARIRETLKKDPQRLKVLLEERFKIKTKVPLITEAFGVPQEPSPVTYLLEAIILDDKLFQVFNAKCRAHKVTINSGFFCVTNMALIKLVREGGIVRDSYTTSSHYPVNTARYMSDVKPTVMGYHALPMTQTMETPWNVRKHFWEYVVNFNAKFRSQIERMGPLEERVLDSMLQLDTLHHKHKVIYDIHTVSIYSPHAKTYGNGKHVQLTDFKAYFPIPQNEYGIAAAIQHFRDKVQYQINVSSGFITRENAAKLSDNVLSVFYDITKSAN